MHTLSAMATFSRVVRGKLWAGTTADLSAIAAEARRLVVAAKPESEEGDVRFRMTVSRPGRDDEYEHPEEFEEHETSDLRSIDDIAIHVSTPGYPTTLRLSIYFFRTSGASFNVEGPDQVRVNGLASALEPILQRGYRRVRWLRDLPFLLLGLAIGVSFWTGTLSADKHRTASRIVAVVAAALLLVAGATAVVRKIVPALEVRLPGQPTQLRQIVGGPARWVLGAVGTALILVLVERLVPK
jgi:uncharacterized membrane protein (UPF0136 family)